MPAIVINEPVHAAYDQESLARELELCREAAINKYVVEGVIGAKVEDPNLMRSSAAVTFMMQQLGLVQLSRDVVVKLQQQQSNSLSE